MAVGARQAVQRGVTLRTWVEECPIRATEVGAKKGRSARVTLEYVVRCIAIRKEK